MAIAGLNHQLELLDLESDYEQAADLFDQLTVEVAEILSKIGIEVHYDNQYSVNLNGLDRNEMQKDFPFDIRSDGKVITLNGGNTIIGLSEGTDEVEIYTMPRAEGWYAEGLQAKGKNILFRSKTPGGDQKVALLRPGMPPIQWTAYSSDFALTDGDGIIFITPEGTLVREHHIASVRIFEYPKRLYNQEIFSGEGLVVTICRDDHSMRIWDEQSGQKIDDCQDVLGEVIFVPDKKTLYFIGTDRVPYRMEIGGKIEKLPMLSGLRSWSLSPNGKHLFACTRKFIYSYDFDQGKWNNIYDRWNVLDEQGIGFLKMRVSDDQIIIANEANNLIFFDYKLAIGS